jgi:endonuclease G
MKLKQFSLSVIVCAICFATTGFSQSLKIGDGLKDIPNRKHLAFESNKSDSILYYQGYTVIFSYAYNLPRFIFELLTVDQLTLDSTRTPAKRSSSFFTTTLPNGKLSATNRDYLKSGYDRGHMVPAGDFVWNKELKDETFFYTNINPQTPTLNRGIWANLESRIRDNVIKHSENAYVVTGAIFNPECLDKIGPDSLCVPVSYFKIVYFESRKTMFAFLFDNTVDKYEGAITDFQVSVDFIEQITGEDFFDLLDDAMEAKMESVVAKFND